MTVAAARPIKIAIVGSGPSAFYAATRALTASSPPVSAVHIYESLPTPFGLVRAGVAPDHPDVKNVTHRFTDIVREATAAGRFRFFGNVRVVAGPSTPAPALEREDKQSRTLELPLEDLFRSYTHLILAYGSAQARTLSPSVSGQDLRGVCSALDFVNWYNGHPDAHSAVGGPPATTPWLDIIRPGAHHVSIIGAGNVALDVARILLRARSPTSSFLASTDIPSSVLTQLSASNVEHVSIVARRGIAQLAFTNKEVREMLTLAQKEGIVFKPLSKEDGELALADVARLKEIADKAGVAAKGAGSEVSSSDKEALSKKAAELAGDLRIRKRLVDLLIKGSGPTKPEAVGIRKSWSIDAFRAPDAILPSASAQSYVGQVRWKVTEPVSPSSSAKEPSAAAVPSTPADTPTWGGGAPPSGSTSASTSSETEPQWGSVRPSGQTVTSDTDAVVYSLGYVGAPLPLPSGELSSNHAAWQALVPFDDRRGVIKNDKGAVSWNAHAANKVGLSPDQLPRLHTTGWIGRGPVGVIASTMYDAYDTVDLLLSQAASSPLPTLSSEGEREPAAPPPRIESALLTHRIGNSGPARRDALTPRSLPSPHGTSDLALPSLAGTVVEWQDWEIVDELERAAGAAVKKEREKVVVFG